jgi:hypothetical protein
MAQLLGSSITYRIAAGPHQGRKVFTLQTLPGCEEPLDHRVGTLAALVPKPRVHLSRFHRVFASNSSNRVRVTPARRGRGSQHTARADREDPHPAG